MDDSKVVVVVLVQYFYGVSYSLLLLPSTVTS